MIVKEIFRFQLFERGVERVVVEQDRPQDAAPRLGILGQLTFERGGWSGHRIIRFMFARRRYLCQMHVQNCAGCDRRSACLVMLEHDRWFAPAATMKKPVADLWI